MKLKQRIRLNEGNASTGSKENNPYDFDEDMDLNINIVDVSSNN